jgi:hypothetical protein
MAELSKVETEQIQILEDLRRCGYDLAKLGLPAPETIQEKWQAQRAAAAVPVSDRQIEQNYQRDVLWVYHNFSNRNAMRSGAPSASAWCMREAFQEDPREFYETILLRVMKLDARPATRDQNEADIEHRPKKSIAELQEILRDAVAESQRLV